MLYEECDMKHQGKGMIFVNRLSRSSRIALPPELEHAA